MATFYVGLWLAAVVAGRLMAASVGSRRAFDVLAAAWFFAAVFSVGAALVQLTGLSYLGIFVADFPPGARPFGNLAQPNHFSTLCFLGLTGALWLHESQKIRSSVFLCGAIFLLLGMVISQSRTAWLQIGLLAIGGFVYRERASLRLTRLQILTLVATFVAGVLLWPSICESLLLSPGRSLEDQMLPGVRLTYWRSMLDALTREPWFGYGWQQVELAQQRVALEHPATGVLFRNSHNLVLDFLLWNGIPFGVLILAAAVWWFVIHLRECRDARRWWLLTAVCGILVHAMLEYPLEYAYFLIPAGLAMGGVDRGGSSTFSIRWPILLAVAMTSAFCVIASEYLKAEEYYRAFRLEDARIGVDRLMTPVPELYVLTQLKAFFIVSRTEPTEGMSTEQIATTRDVSARFGYGNAMFRYALVAGFNGRPETARDTLARICRIHGPKHCADARAGWAMRKNANPILPTL